MTAQVTVRNWGNSRGICIPKKIMDAMRIQTSDTLDLRVEDGKMILEKAFRHRTLEERAAAYGGEIALCLFDWGEPQGREML